MYFSLKKRFSTDNCHVRIGRATCPLLYKRLSFYCIDWIHALAAAEPQPKSRFSSGNGLGFFQVLLKDFKLDLPFTLFEGGHLLQKGLWWDTYMAVLVIHALEAAESQPKSRFSIGNGIGFSKFNLKTSD